MSLLQVLCGFAQRRAQQGSGVPKHRVGPNVVLGQQRVEFGQNGSRPVPINGRRDRFVRRGRQGFRAEAFEQAGIGYELVRHMAGDLLAGGRNVSVTIIRPQLEFPSGRMLGQNAVLAFARLRSLPRPVQRIDEQANQRSHRDESQPPPVVGRCRDGRGFRRRKESVLEAQRDDANGHQARIHPPTNALRMMGSRYRL